MKTLKEHIRKEIQELREAEIIKKYDIPSEIKDALENKLKMNPLIRFVSNLKAVNSIPPSYRIFLLNGNYFDIYYEEFSLMAKIGTKEYFLADLDERNYAIKDINRLVTDPIMKKGDDEDTAGEDTETTSPPPPTEEPEV